jgi:hypothetical protein
MRGVFGATAHALMLVARRSSDMDPTMITSSVGSNPDPSAARAGNRKLRRVGDHSLCADVLRASFAACV